MVKAIIFDFDDTLIMTLKASIPHHEKVAKELGCHIDMQKYYEKWGLPWPEFISHVIPDVDFDTFYKAYVKFLRDKKIIYPKVKGCDIAIKELYSKKFVLGILSSSIKENILERAELAGIPLDLMDSELFYSFENTKTHKPDPAVFKDLLIVLKERGISNEEVVYCGDHINDYLAARNASINFIGVTTGLHTRNDFMIAGLAPHLILNSVEGLPVKIEEMNNGSGISRD